MKHTKSICALICATFLAQTAHANDVIPFRDGYQLGDGVDAVSGEKRGLCVTFDDVEGVLKDKYSAQQSLTSFNRIETTDEFNALLGLKASASYSSFASAKMDFKRTKSFNKHTLYVLAKAFAERVGEQIKSGGARLTQEAWDLLEQEEYERFKEKCGSGFIGLITSGGEFYALYQFASSDEKELEQIEAKASFSYGVAKGSVDFEEKVTQLSEAANLSVDFYVKGGSETLAPETAQDAIDTALTFRAKVFELDESLALNVTLWDYTILEMPPGARLRIQNTALINEVQDIETRLGQYDDALANLNYVTKFPDQFDATDEVNAQIIQKMQEISDARRVLVKRGQFCLDRDIDKCLDVDFEKEIVDINLRSIIPERIGGLDQLAKESIDLCDAATKPGAQIVLSRTYANSVAFVVAGATNTYVPKFEKHKPGRKFLACNSNLNIEVQKPGDIVATQGNSSSGTSNPLPTPTPTPDASWTEIDGLRWKSEPLAANCTAYTLSRDGLSSGSLHVSFQERHITNPENSQGDVKCVSLW